VELKPERYLTLFVSSDALLRKPRTAPQRKRFGDELKAFRDAAQDHADALGFVCLSEDVSVSLHINAPSGRGRPMLPPVVKAYLDALEKIAYDNDRRIAHLVVVQDPLAHPMMDGYTPPDVDDAKSSVFVEVEPIADYRDRYDRAVRTTFWRRGPSAWHGGWGVGDEWNLGQTRERAKRDRSPGRLELLRMLEEKQLRSGALADIDRPGQLPTVTHGMHRVIPLQRMHATMRQRAGAVLLLELRGGPEGSSDQWKQDLVRKLEEFRETRAGLPFGGFVALDIAVRGESLKGKDLDNLAHSILAPFEEILCERRGTVVSYRAYVAEGDPQGVQVRMLDHTRLLELDAVLGEMRATPPLEERLRTWSERVQAHLEVAKERHGRR
jgi:hypothetical protein